MDLTKNPAISVQVGDAYALSVSTGVMAWPIPRAAAVRYARNRLIADLTETVRRGMVNLGAAAAPSKVEMTWYASRKERADHVAATFAAVRDALAGLGMDLIPVEVTSTVEAVWAEHSRIEVALTLVRADAAR